MDTLYKNLIDWLRVEEDKQVNKRVAAVEVRGDICMNSCLQTSPKAAKTNMTWVTSEINSQILPKFKWIKKKE